MEGAMSSWNGSMGRCTGGLSGPLFGIVAAAELPSGQRAQKSSSLLTLWQQLLEFGCTRFFNVSRAELILVSIRERAASTASPRTPPPPPPPFRASQKLFENQFVAPKSAGAGWFAKVACQYYQTRLER